MKHYWLLPLVIILTFCIGCKKNADTPVTEPAQTEPIILETIQEATPTETEDPIVHIPSLVLTDPQDQDFVRVRDYIPDAYEELKYATAENFTGSVIYSFQDTYLRYGTVRKLMAVQQELAQLGLGIKIWDGFRPISAQFKLWEIYPNDTYVADPNKGFSNHSRGNAVDLTLVDTSGKELEMPTEFDDFSGRADRNYSEIPQSARENAQLLESIMQKHGLQGYYGEWWHYNDTVRFDPEWVFDPGLISCWQVTGEEPLVMVERTNPNLTLRTLQPGTVVTVMGYDGDRAYISWDGVRGYVDCIRLVPV